MTRTHNTRFRVLYGLVAGVGVVLLLIAVYQLTQNQVSRPWVVLSLLTLVAGSLSLKIPGVAGRVCMGDALISLSVLLCGPLPGAVTAALEGIAGSLRCRNTSRRLQFVVFNAGVMALSAYAAGKVFFAALGQPTLHSGNIPTAGSLPGPLLAFAAVYFVVNTLLVAAASALDRSDKIFQTWWRGFAWTSVNCVAAAFVAGMLVQSEYPLALSGVVVLIVGSVAVYLNARAHVRLAHEVEQQQAQPAGSAAKTAGGASA